MVNRATEYLANARAAESKAARSADSLTSRQLLEIAGAWRALAAHAGRLERRWDWVAPEHRVIRDEPED